MAELQTVKIGDARFESWHTCCVRPCETDLTEPPPRGKQPKENVVLEIEEAAIENRGTHVILLVKRAKLAEDQPDEWREVARHYGRGSVAVKFPEAWREGTPLPPG